MTQSSRPQAETTPTYTDAGPYSRNQWAERLYAVYTGDENTANQRTQLRGVVPSFDNMLIVTNAAGVTITVGTGAGISGGSFLFNSAAVDFEPTTPIADRIDRVVIVENNTNAVYNTGLEFPADLTDYGGVASVPPYSARLAILIGTPGGAATDLVHTTNYWMVPLAEYTISNVPAISGLTDLREFMGIETVVSIVAASNDEIQDAAIFATEVNDGAGANGLGVGLRFRLEDTVGVVEDAAQFAVRWSDATSGSEDSRLELRLESGGAENLGAVINAPTAASADGNARGVGAVDLQQTRTAVTQVASGSHSFIAGGERNTASGADSHAEGFNTIASGAYSHAEGWGSRATNDAAHGEGYNGYASEIGSHSGGVNSLASKHAQFARAGVAYAFSGDAQYSDYPISRSVLHNDANWYQLYLDGLADQITLLSDQVLTFDCLIVGTTQGCTKSFAFRIVGIIENDGGTTSLLASTVTTIYDVDDVSFDARASADDANDALLIEVQDSDGAGDTVRWSAVVRASEILFPA